MDTKEVQKEPEEDDLVIDPYQVVNTTGKQIDYDKIITRFGIEKITPALLDKVKALSNREPHHYLRRGIFFSHRDLDQVLKQVEDGKSFYLYTGRGPSGESLHVGHLMPFIFTRYLQEAFGAIVVIQLTDDEKFFHKTGEATLEEFTRFGIENAKDIIACGFDINKTFIFLNTDYVGHMYSNICKFQRGITINQLKGIFGLTESDNCGKASYPAIQAAPVFSSSFKHIFGNDNVRCLVPQGIDQDPYFRMARDVCNKLHVDKTACIHSQFLPGLYGFGTKMSTTDPNSAIFLTDTPEQIRDKINKHAVSGGGTTKKEHQEKGANLEIDVSYQYLRIFLENDERLKQIDHDYSKGIMMTSEVKNELIEILTKIVVTHQENRAKVTEEQVRAFMKIRPLDYVPQN